jgi:putative transposase
VLDLLAHYRAGAALLRREQWRLFQDEPLQQEPRRGQDDLRRRYRRGEPGADVPLSGGRPVAGLGQRANEFRDAVNRSTLPPDAKHMLHVINRMGAWFLRTDVVMRETGEIIPDHIRRLARSIMRHVMGRNCKPDLSRISMRLDHRAACLAAPTKATQAGRVGWWVNLSTMEPGKKKSPSRC